MSTYNDNEMTRVVMMIRVLLGGEQKKDFGSESMKEEEEFIFQ
jgi:hypothetical protein